MYSLFKKTCVVSSQGNSDNVANIWWSVKKAYESKETTLCEKQNKKHIKIILKNQIKTGTYNINYIISIFKLRWINVNKSNKLNVHTKIIEV